MKEVVDFILWQWNKWEFWQKCFVVGAFFFGLGLGLPEPYGHYVLALPVTAWFVAVGKWWIWNPLKDNWAAYKKEKRELFSTIKESDL
jgi:hypothetical protein